MNVPFLDLKAHHAPIRDEIFDAISEVVNDSAFAGGKYVEKFEKEWAAYCGVGHAVGVSNGTESLSLILRALGIGTGDEVIVPAMTFVATAEAVSHVGATPVFVDIDPWTHTMDPSKLENVITERTRAIIPVHIFGQCADMNAIGEVAGSHKGLQLHVIEDAAQAHGAIYKGRKAGSLSYAASFSFYPGKNMGAWGEAGAATTSNPFLAAKIRLLREHGSAKKYHHEIVGFNARMDGIQAAVLSVKLKYLDINNDKRRAIAREYARLLSDPIAQLFAAGTYSSPAYHVYAHRVPNRDTVLAHMAAQGVTCGIHYPVPVHLQPAYAYLGYKAGAFPVAEACANEFLSLPMYPELTDAQLAHVVSSLKAGLS